MYFVVLLKICLFAFPQPLWGYSEKSSSEFVLADVLAKVREAAEQGELDALIEKQAQFGRRLTPKSK